MNYLVRSLGRQHTDSAGRLPCLNESRIFVKLHRLWKDKSDLERSRIVRSVMFGVFREAVILWWSVVVGVLRCSRCPSTCLVCFFRLTALREWMWAWFFSRVEAEESHSEREKSESEEKFVSHFLWLHCIMVYRSYSGSWTQPEAWSHQKVAQWNLFVYLHEIRSISRIYWLTNDLGDTLTLSAPLCFYFTVL